MWELLKHLLCELMINQLLTQHFPLLAWFLASLEDAFFDKLIGCWAAFDLLFQAVCPHAFLKALLVCGEGGSSIAFW